MSCSLQHDCLHSSLSVSFPPLRLSVTHPRSQAGAGAGHSHAPLCPLRPYCLLLSSPSATFTPCTPKHMPIYTARKLVYTLLSAIVERLGCSGDEINRGPRGCSSKPAHALCLSRSFKAGFSLAPACRAAALCCTAGTSSPAACCCTPHGTHPPPATPAAAACAPSGSCCCSRLMLTGMPPGPMPIRAFMMSTSHCPFPTRLCSSVERSPAWRTTYEGQASRGAGASRAGQGGRLAQHYTSRSLSVHRLPGATAARELHLAVQTRQRAPAY